MSELENNEVIIQYVPFSSFVHPSFWHTLTDTKLNVDKLNESSKPIHGRFIYQSDILPLFEVDGISFNRSPQINKFSENVSGTLLNKNTLDDFKNIDKAELLNSVGQSTWNIIKSQTWITRPSSLLNFIILSFADLKKYHYYYWFAFPSPKEPSVYMTDRKKITEEFNDARLEELHEGFTKLDADQKCFFVVQKHNNNTYVKTLSEILENIDGSNLATKLDLTTTYFAFTDPSNCCNPGWPLRLFLAALLAYAPNLSASKLQIIGLRCDGRGYLGSSLIFNVKIPEDVKNIESSGWVGWERNDKGKFGPRLANMSAVMDPVKLADATSDLNIKLMKWRLAPDLNVDVMKETKCLILGAGTLGCHVASNLLAWGFRHFTFIDNGKVSYSNPTRQILYSFKDCVGGSKNKAEAAAENLRKILPTVISKGLPVHIPMPGHPVGESMKEETISNIKIITEEIINHDVIFILLDSREARWLPTLLAGYHGKIVINAALGFDTYLVMRHGCMSAGTGEGSISNDVASSSRADESLQLSYLPGDHLGCYFCYDVTAPGNSQKSQTLDQQCTVTRPGAAAMAASHAVELLVSLLQHPLRGKAPALCKLIPDSSLPPELSGVLGPIPHSIRGFLSLYNIVTPTTYKFRMCIACSDIVKTKYRDEGLSFLFEVFNGGKYLENITGLTELQISAEINDVKEFDIDEEVV